MNRLLVLMVAAVVGSSLVGCASPAAEEDAASSEGAATAEARAQLEAYTGAWKVVEDRSEYKSFPEAITIQVVDDEVDPTTKETKGTRLRLMRADHTNVPAVDRAPFVGVDEEESCDNVSMGGGVSVTVCHVTALSNGGATLTHTVTLKSYKWFVFPSGWSKATQVLTRSGDKLHYTYEIDGEPAADIVLGR